MTEELNGAVAWNRTYPMAEGEQSFWQIGPLQLWACRLPGELRIAYRQEDDARQERLLIEVPSDRSEPDAGAKLRRFSFQQPPGSIELVPALADRPLVVGLDDRLLVPPQQETTLFISTPLWVRVVAGGAATGLLDQPIQRPSDTWFGPSTMTGELCYATRTNARLHLENLPLRPGCAVSVVQVRNQAKTDLELEKLRLPALEMSTYVTGSGYFWTENVTLERHEDGDNASVRLGKGPPWQAPDATLAAGPRSASSGGLLTRAFGGLLR
jgi:hypothetical protein